jgi:O-antigen ligase
VKWAALALLLTAAFPLNGWLRRNPHQAFKVWILMGFLPFVVGDFHLYMAAVSWPLWPGYVKGMEISVLDVLAVAIYLALPTKRFALPFRLSSALYFLAVLLSVLQATVPMATLFYCWQLARMFLIYAVAAKACDDEKGAPMLLTGMTLGLCYEACVVIWERVGLGVLQAGGTLGHQNYLGLVSHFVTFPSIALLLAGQRGWQPIVAPIAGLITVALTVSRAAVGLFGIGFVGLFGLSAVRRWTGRKAMVLAGSLALAILATPLIISSFQTRFNEQQRIQENYDERAAFEKAAGMIISDHPMGVGANYYVVAANTEGYNSKAGVAAVIGSDGAIVHNIYYLAAAETGYIGLVAFIFMLVQPVIVAFRCGWRNRGDRRGDLLLGIGTALLMVYVHSYFEWIFVTFSAQYMFALSVGMVAGLATQLGYWRLPKGHQRISIASSLTPNAKVTRF